MPNINSLTYNGMKSTDLGVYVTGSGSFDAAEMDADKYEIAGRNGDLIIPKNRYKNIVVTYPAFIPKAFQEKAQSIRNWMRSAKAYARLEDTYDMEHYRLGLASGIQSFEPVNRNDASNFQLSFDCKPQRFLKTGETPLPIEPEAHSYSGEIVSFETVAVDDMTKAEVSLSPIQSLNGYDHPWAGGAGKNKVGLAHSPARTQIYSGLTIDTQTDDLLKLTSTSSDTYACVRLFYTLPAGTYTVKFKATSTDSYVPIVSIYDAATYALINGWGSIPANTERTATLSAETGIDVRFFATLNTTAARTVTFTEFQLESGSTATTFAPYENLCPISGHTGATLNVTGKNLLSMLNPEGTSGATVTENDDGGITVTTGSTNAYIQYIVTGKLAAGTYTLTNLASDRNIYIQKTPTDYSMSVGIGASKSFEYDGTGYLRILFTNQPTYSTNTYKIMLNVGSTAEPYAPFNPSSAQYTSSFGQTVYGGTFDFVSGKLVVEWANVEVDADWYWYKGSSQPTGLSVISTTSFPDHVYAVGDMSCCSHYKKASNIYIADMTLGTFLLSTTGITGYFCVSDDVNYTVDDFKAYLRAQKSAGTPVTVCYKLATPIEIDITPAQVQTLLGLNNVWASDGTVEINYADPFNVDNPTYFEARPLFEITNPAQNDVLNVNGKTITFLSSYTGTVTIDCETMNCYSGYANMNYLISATDFPVLNEGLNIVTWSGSGTCTMTPRWWEL